MKPDSFILDRRLYDLFQQGHLRQFTTQELRGAYATHLTGMTFNSSDLRRYVYEQIRRMLQEDPSLAQSPPVHQKVPEVEVQPLDPPE